MLATELAALAVLLVLRMLGVGLASRGVAAAAADDERGVAAAAADDEATALAFASGNYICTCSQFLGP
jgi:hypothetical protein